MVTTCSTDPRPPEVGAVGPPGEGAQVAQILKQAPHVAHATGPAHGASPAACASTQAQGEPTGARQRGSTGQFWPWAISLPPLLYRKLIPFTSIND